MTFVTPDEYLERERAAELRSEYREGQIWAMAGASRSHNRIAGNVFALLWNQFRGGSCEAYNNDMKVRLPKTFRYVYPDFVAVCGDRQFEDDKEDVLVNPTLIVEVLSDSTEAYDRGEKWVHYQQLPSLQEYVLVSQSRAMVERFVRQGDLWIYSLTVGLESAVAFAGVDVVLAVADIYEGVTLTPDEASVTETE